MPPNAPPPGRKNPSTPGALLEATRALLPTVYGEGKVHPNPDHPAWPFLEYLSTAGDGRTDPKATARNRKLQLVQRALAAFLYQDDSPEQGYQLACDHLQTYVSGRGPSLTGASRGKLCELVGFVFVIEGYEEHHG